MTTRQEPIGSGFAPTSTTDDVIAGLELTGIDALRLTHPGPAETTDPGE